MTALPFPPGGKIARSSVPCGTCTACCRYEAILLEKADDPDLYELKEPCVHPITGEPTFRLLHGSDHACAYLGPEGCTIYDHAPVTCQAFDCRLFFKKYDRKTRRLLARESKHTGQVFQAGHDRLRSLDLPEGAER